MQSCGRRQPVKGDWRAFNRASIAAYAVETLDRLPPPATKSIQAIKAASDRRLAAFHVLPNSQFKRSRISRPPLPTRRTRANCEVRQRGQSAPSGRPGRRLERLGARGGGAARLAVSGPLPALRVARLGLPASPASMTLFSIDYAVS